jgi:ADP-heptose:LPS heptosyltransferase
MPFNPFHWIIRKWYNLLFLGTWEENIDPIDPLQVKKILIIRNDNIGDVICTTPLVEVLRRLYPQAFLAILVCRLTEEVVQGNPFLDKIYVYDKAKHGRYKTVWEAWWKQFEVLREIRSKGFDLVLGVRCGFSTPQAWMAFFSRAKWRVGRSPDPKEKKFSFFYTHLLPQAFDQRNEVLKGMDFLSPLEKGDEDLRLYFPISQEADEKALAFLQGHGLDGHHPLVGIHLTSRVEDNRYWADDKYVHLIKTLSSRPGIKIVFSFGPDKKEEAERILRALPVELPRYCPPDLKTFGALAKALDVMITLEGGPMHVTAAVGTPLVALFGKTDPVEWAPWGKGHLVLRKGTQENAITAEEVLSAVDQQLARLSERS